jgi:hypothetical protein
MPKTAQTYSDSALDALNAGFVSKAGQNDAIADLRRAYEIHCEVIASGLLADRSIAGWNDLYYGKPDLHNWKPRHSAAYALWADQVAEIEKLVELRTAIKAAPVNAPARKEPSPYEVKARETLMDLCKRRNSQYLRAIDLAAVFNGLPVSANTHSCVADTGTPYLRTFYYLAGEFTALSVIIAAADEIARRDRAA